MRLIRQLSFWSRVLGVSLGLLVLAPVAVANPAADAALEAFLVDLATRQHFDLNALRKLFSQVKIRPNILTLMQRGAKTTGKPTPFYKYRLNFVTPQRINYGVTFMRSHQQALARAEAEYGVPAEVIAGIIGVETIFGRNTGKVSILDALTTIAFHYPPRADYFRSELEAFLLLCREQGFDPQQPTGSYAGAMGLGQFMPSSYRKYLVDFDGDGRRDAWDVEDAIGSVARYLQAYGWQRGQAITLPTQVQADKVEGLLALGIEPRHSLQHLQSQGLRLASKLPAQTPVSLLRLDTELGPAYWAAFRNFYVITRYNHSQRYAMAVAQLAAAIGHEKAAAQYAGQW